MNTRDLVVKLAEHWDMTQKDARKLLDVIVRTFNDNIAAGKRFTVPKLGTFGTNTRKKRKSFNPHYEQYMMLPPKRVVKYNASKGIKEDLKKVDIDDE